MHSGWRHLFGAFLVATITASGGFFFFHFSELQDSLELTVKQPSTETQKRIEKIESPEDIAITDPTIDTSDLANKRAQELQQKILDNETKTTPADLNSSKHLPLPDPVKVVYMSSYVAGDKKLRKRIVDLVDSTELNSIIIDIKDYSGTISFKIDNETINEVGATSNRIPDIESFIDELHEKNIYVIGRLTAFQDPKFAKKYPSQAVKRLDGETIWRDNKDIAWTEAASTQMWDYLATIAEESHKVGFDEINFDYIRFPSDGNLRDVSYPLRAERTRREVMKDFYEYLDGRLRKEGIIISADLFGMVTTNYDDLGIGQVLEDALPYFDAIAPMVYPSHYPKTFAGYENPAEHPYGLIKKVVGDGVKRATAAGYPKTIIRPWLQDFSLFGTTYGSWELRQQIDASEEVGATSWMLWDSANTYHAGGLNPPETTKAPESSE